MQLEELGEKTFKLFEKLYYYLISLVIAVVVVFKDLKSRTSILEKEKIYKRFKDRDIDFRDYGILRVQITGFLYFLVVFLGLFGFLTLTVVWVLLIVFGLATLYLLFLLRDLFKEEFGAYRDFFLGYLGIATILLFYWRFLNPGNYIGLFLVSLALVTLFFLGYRMRYSRDFTYGRVISAGPIIRVKLNYDILGGVKGHELMGGIRPVVVSFNNRIGAKEGDWVKLKVERGVLSFQGARPSEVLERVKYGGQ